MTTHTASIHCPKKCQLEDPSKKARVVRYGMFFRACDREAVPRYRCNKCYKTFSRSTFEPEFRQKKRDINLDVFKSLCSNVSMRRTADNEEINVKTVARRFSYFEGVARSRHELFLESRSKSTHIQFDDMETSEHTKLKPLSLPLTVDEKTREILSFDVVRMPAKGTEAAISRKKYGKREDMRPTGWRNVLQETSRGVAFNVVVTSDQHTSYPRMIRENLPGAIHIRKKGRKACVAGQGELKSGGFDPLFAFNHTAASLRANINRLIRKTWCTTKRPDRLKSHIAMYAYWHNERIAAELQDRKPVFAF